MYMMENVHLTASFYDLIQVQPLLQKHPMRPHQVSVTHVACGVALPGCTGELNPLLLLNSPDIGGGVQCGVNTAGNKHSFPKKRKDCHQLGWALQCG